MGYSFQLNSSSALGAAIADPEFGKTREGGGGNNPLICSAELTYYTANRRLNKCRKRELGKGLGLPCLGPVSASVKK